MTPKRCVRGKEKAVRLGLSWADAATVVISAVGVYVAFLILIRIVGQRALAAMSSFDFAAAIALGAVMGRAVLGYTPTLAAGVLGMATLFALQAVFGVLRRNRRLDRALSNLPLLLMANGTVLPDNLRKAKIVEDELRQKLRQAGIRRYADVAAVILERTGAVSILRQGETIAPELTDVRGRELLAADHIRRPGPRSTSRLAPRALAAVHA
jgi:uncharacterized membrane protein YcaP (DUF421 family)